LPVFKKPQPGVVYGGPFRTRVLLGVLLYLGAAAPCVQAEDSPLIRSIQDTPLSALDPNAPKVKLSQWLAQLGGVRPAALAWELNDCGEGGDGRAAPTCVEGRVSFSPDRSASVSVAVATAEGKLGGGPSVFMMYVREGQKVDFAKSFQELEKLVAKWRK
jgi:hypothetical protein